MSRQPALWGIGAAIFLLLAVATLVRGEITVPLLGAVTREAQPLAFHISVAMLALFGLIGAFVIWRRPD